MNIDSAIGKILNVLDKTADILLDHQKRLKELEAEVTSLKNDKLPKA